MEVNASTSIASQGIANNKAQVGLDVLTRTLAKSEQAAPAQGDAMRLDIAQQTGKGQNIDIKA